uniref:Uncharacterized protein n=1 Tax=Desertifilum tharense IPPAS B-1220 TaxID=1781255 RepID=A0ACD5H0Q1_9CYAN
MGDVLSLSYSLDDRVEYLLTIEPNVPEIPPVTMCFCSIRRNPCGRN